MSKLLETSKTYKPFHYQWAVEFAEAHEKMHWIHQEADLSKDVGDWHNNLPPVAKNLFHQIMKLFTQSDAQVAQNYIDFLLPVFKNNEIRQMLLAFAAREGVHQRAYAAILETLNLPDSEFEAFLDYKEMFEKIDFWKLNDTHSQTGKALAVAKNIFAEGVSLFGSFIMLLNYQRYGLMLGTNEINRWSILDEECCVKGTEVLTINGYIKIEDLTLDDMVLQYDVYTKEHSFVNPTDLIKKTTKETYLFESENISQEVTANHRMVTKEGIKLAKDITKEDNLIISGYKPGTINSLSECDLEMIKKIKNGENTLEEWLTPILTEVSSEWANEFLTVYNNL